MSRFRIFCALSNKLSSIISRRSYSALTNERIVTKELKEKISSNVNIIVEERDMSHWVPDPLTGFYKPANQMGKEIDAADLRAAMLRSKRAPNSPYDGSVEEEIGVAELRHNAMLDEKKSM